MTSRAVTQHWPGIGRVLWGEDGRVWQVLDDIVQGATYAGFSGSKRTVIAVRDGNVTYRHHGRPTLLTCSFDEFRAWSARRVS